MYRFLSLTIVFCILCSSFLTTSASASTYDWTIKVVDSKQNTFSAWITGELDLSQSSIMSNITDISYAINGVTKNPGGLKFASTVNPSTGINKYGFDVFGTIDSFVSNSNYADLDFSSPDYFSVTVYTGDERLIEVYDDNLKFYFGAIVNKSDFIISPHVNNNSVPEPSGIALFALASAALLYSQRRRFQVRSN